jgi:polyisoprenoid-binding protein YceI
MKRFFALIAISSLFVACGGPEGTAVESMDAVDAAAETTTELVSSAQYNVDPAASIVNWEGAKVAYGHVGTVPVTSGQLMVAEGKIVGGKFALDLRKMENTDIDEAEKKAKLIGHLQSADFFDTEKYPMADFVITQVQPASAEAEHTHLITGNLTMKGEQRSITIPASITMEGGMLKATTPKFTIDRNDWGVNYNSSSLEGIAKDNIINDNIGLEITLVAGK